MTLSREKETVATRKMKGKALRNVRKGDSAFHLESQARESAELHLLGTTAFSMQ